MNIGISNHNISITVRVDLEMGGYAPQTLYTLSPLNQLEGGEEHYKSQPML